MSDIMPAAQVAEIRADLTPTIDELCPFHDLGREGAVCDCPPGHPNHIQPGTRPATPADARVKEISVRYEGFGQPDPPCTCTRTDVDFYDTSGCERCDRKSDYNRADSHAKYMLDLHGAQDIYFLCDSYDAQARTVTALGEQLEHDRSLVANCVTRAREAVNSRDWMTQGRGPYEWNDDKWHEEFSAAAEEFIAALEPMRKVAADWSSCPMDATAIAKARIDLKATVDAQARRIEELESPRATVSDDYWDAHATECGNCGLRLISKGRDGLRSLSDPGDSEDEALCGGCAGAEMYAQAAEIERLKADASTVARGYEQTIKDRNDENARLKAKLAEAERDSARLNWMLIVLQLRGSDGLAKLVWDKHHAWDSAAIDAAMQPEQAKEQG